MNLRRFIERKAKAADLAEEIDSHLAHERDAQTARGLPSEEARRRANLKFGDQNSLRDRMWRYHSLPWLESIGRDLRFVLRSFAKTPGFTIIAILVIAVGIGVNTAVFSVINTVLLKPLAYPDPQSLVMLMNTGPRGSFPGASVPKFNTWNQQRSVFDKVAAFDRGGRRDEPHRRGSSAPGAGRPCLCRLLLHVWRAADRGTHIHRRRRSSARRPCSGVELRALEEPVRRQCADRRLNDPARRGAVSSGWSDWQELRDGRTHRSMDALPVRPELAGPGALLRGGSTAETGHHHGHRRMRK